MLGRLRALAGVPPQLALLALLAACIAEPSMGAGPIEAGEERCRAVYLNLWLAATPACDDYRIAHEQELCGRDPVAWRLLVSGCAASIAGALENEALTGCVEALAGACEDEGR